MKYFSSDCFTYKNDKMFCEKVSLTKIAKEFGTPLFVYSKNFFEDHYRELSTAFKDINHKIFLPQNLTSI